MQTGAITQYIDVAQLVLYAFWIFFAGLIFYLHRENKREGYPLEMEGSGRVVAEGFPSMPKPKSYLLRSGRVVMAPDPKRDDRQLAAKTFAGHPGAPLVPTGNPMLDGIGPGAYAMRPDTPDLTVDDLARIVPLRVAGPLGFDVHDTDPRGLPVIGCDGAIGGTVRDLWVDRAEMVFRYLEIDAGGKTVLLPINFARIKRRGVQVDSITGAQFAAVPVTRSPDQITMLEEERVMAYYGAGTLYATAKRSEPLL
jgi:photosynthetic reaction center H subunit